MVAVKNAFCSFCGTHFDQTALWPRTCHRCKQTSYVNPVPVAVLILDIGGGVLAVRRAIAPHIGKLALPGGFIGVGESWQRAGVREVFEETTIAVDETKISDLYTRSAPDGTVLVFGSVKIAPPDLSGFKPNEEVSELTILRQPTELAFPLHTNALSDYLGRVNRSE
ncbi:MAG: hypothetical protein JWN40_2336 [Phycisphaerales bacterium]|jgi:8-oxo-dGTP pyrophosphatase MutT (NUDIX family)|nr:hypothetical protein [Phycisphaerales bacterium]